MDPLLLCISLSLASVAFGKFPRARNIALLGASYAFHAVVSPHIPWVIAVVTLIGYCGAMILQKTERKKMWLSILIGMHALLFIGLKYAKTIAETLGTPDFSTDSPSLYLLVPIGLSFFIFQNIGYVIDVGRGKAQPERSIVRFALFIAFFPKLIAGPIERSNMLLPQLRKKTRYTTELLSQSLYLSTWGAVLKFVIAENANGIATPFFDNPVSGISFFAGVLAYTVQIFADFAGYSFMAMGIAGLLGIRLSWNFGTPYLSANPSSFWKNWHITLSEWFRDYVYIPLGGNRKGELRTYGNLMITMTLCGLWHGTGMMFVIWGAYQGLLLCGHRFLLQKNLLSWMSTLPHALKAAFFFPCTVFGWIVFRSSDLQTFGRILSQWNSPVFTEDLLRVLLLFSPVILMQIIEKTSSEKTPVTKIHPGFQAVFYYAALYMILYLPPLEVQQFIYVQF